MKTYRTLKAQTLGHNADVLLSFYWNLDHYLLQTKGYNIIVVGADSFLYSVYTIVSN